MNICIVHPLRDLPTDTVRKLEIYADELRRQGHHVFFPLHDADPSEDPTGLRIARAVTAAMHMAVEVHVWYVPENDDIAFALGAMLMSSETTGPKKRVVIINRDHVLPTVGRSLANMLYVLAGRRSW